MSQCVPRWDLDDNQAPSKPSFRSHSNATSQDGPMVDDYEVAELTWENGQLALHGLGQPRVPAKPIACTSLSTRHTWEKTRTGGTLESIVNQATCLPLHKSSQPAVNQATCLPLHKSSQPAVNGDLVPWFHRHEAAVSMNMDALVPGSDRTKQDVRNTPVTDSVPPRVGCSTRVGSCSDPYATQDEDALLTAGKRARVARAPAAAPEWSIGDQSASHSATFGREYSKHMAMDPRERDMSTAEGFTSTTSFGSQENTSTGKPCSKSSTPFPDENDSVCHSRPQKKAGDEENKKKATGKSSVSTKRSRAAAIHNQSERKRRDKINQRMKTLQKLVPNSSKTDKASMLDEVIEYLKQLQAQVQMMSRMNMQPMMLPMAMQQQLQMSMMAPMAMGMGMGMGVGVMDMNSIGRPNISAMPPILHPAAFMPLASWDGAGDRLPVASTTAMPDPLSAYLACQQQPMTMEAYSRMAAALYQQLQQQPRSNSKS